MKHLCIMPAYNEEDRIEPVLREALSFPWDILVVDSNSTDSTYEAVDRLRGSYGRLDLVHENTSGLASALRKGLNYAFQHGYEVITNLDSDGEHHPKDVYGFTSRLEGRTSAVLGDRFNGRRTPLKDRVVRRAIKVKTGKTIGDPRCGARVYRADALREIVPSLVSVNYSVHAEIAMLGLVREMELASSPFDTRKVRERVLPKGKRGINHEVECLCIMLGRGNYKEGRGLLRRAARLEGASFSDFAAEFENGDEYVS